MALETKLGDNYSSILYPMICAWKRFSCCVHVVFFLKSSASWFPATLRNSYMISYMICSIHDLNRIEENFTVHEKNSRAVQVIVPPYEWLFMCRVTYWNWYHIISRIREEVYLHLNVLAYYCHHLWCSKVRRAMSRRTLTCLRTHVWHQSKT